MLLVLRWSNNRRKFFSWLLCHNFHVGEKFYRDVHVWLRWGTWLVKYTYIPSTYQLLTLFFLVWTMCRKISRYIKKSFNLCSTNIKIAALNVWFAYVSIRFQSSWMVKQLFWTLISVQKIVIHLHYIYLNWNFSTIKNFTFFWFHDTSLQSDNSITLSMWRAHSLDSNLLQQLRVSLKVWWVVVS